MKAKRSNHHGIIEMETSVREALERGAPTPPFCPDYQECWEDRDCLNCPRLENCFQELSSMMTEQKLRRDRLEIFG